MEVKLNSDIVSIARTTGLVPKSKADSAAVPEVSFAESEALDVALAQAPDVRADQVERGKALLSTESYPPPEIQQKIARLLAVALDETQ